MRSQQAALALRVLRRPQCLLPQKRLPVRRGFATGHDHPVDEVVNAQLSNDISNVQTVTSEIPAGTSIDTDTRKSQREETLAKAQIVFGSKLVGPQRQAQIDARSRLIAGILVPPKPEEPDNCCMSGCVNCVWDMYRDEMEDYVAKTTEARAKVEEMKAQSPVSTVPSTHTTGDHLAVSMDDDGGGSESLWSDEESVSGDMFEGVPIGIRAFMENERRLKARRLADAAG